MAPVTTAPALLSPEIRATAQRSGVSLSQIAPPPRPPTFPSGSTQRAILASQRDIAERAILASQGAAPPLQLNGGFLSDRKPHRGDLGITHNSLGQGLPPPQRQQVRAAISRPPKPPKPKPPKPPKEPKPPRGRFHPFGPWALPHLVEPGTGGQPLWADALQRLRVAESVGLPVDKDIDRMLMRATETTQKAERFVARQQREEELRRRLAETARLAVERAAQRAALAALPPAQRPPKLKPPKPPRPPKPPKEKKFKETMSNLILPDSSSFDLRRSYAGVERRPGRKKKVATDAMAEVAVPDADVAAAAVAATALPADSGAPASGEAGSGQTEAAPPAEPERSATEASGEAEAAEPPAEDSAPVEATEPSVESQLERAALVAEISEAVGVPGDVAPTADDTAAVTVEEAPAPSGVEASSAEDVAVEVAVPVAHVADTEPPVEQATDKVPPLDQAVEEAAPVDQATDGAAEATQAVEVAARPGKGAEAVEQPCQAAQVETATGAVEAEEASQLDQAAQLDAVTEAMNAEADASDNDSDAAEADADPEGDGEADQTMDVDEPALDRWDEEDEVVEVDYDDEEAAMNEPDAGYDGEADEEADEEEADEVLDVDAYNDYPEVTFVADSEEEDDDDDRDDYVEVTYVADSDEERAINEPAEPKKRKPYKRRRPPPAVPRRVFYGTAPTIARPRPVKRRRIQRAYVEIVTRNLYSLRNQAASDFEDELEWSDNDRPSRPIMITQRPPPRSVWATPTRVISLARTQHKSSGYIVVEKHTLPDLTPLVIRKLHPPLHFFPLLPPPTPRPRHVTPEPAASISDFGGDGGDTFWEPLGGADIEDVALLQDVGISPLRSPAVRTAPRSPLLPIQAARPSSPLLSARKSFVTPSRPAWQPEAPPLPSVLTLRSLLTTPTSSSSTPAAAAPEVRPTPTPTQQSDALDTEFASEAANIQNSYDSELDAENARFAALLEAERQRHARAVAALASRYKGQVERLNHEVVRTANEIEGGPPAETATQPAAAPDA
ncbi:uncharacterized protein LOC62_07G009047 [Vanrija pseudolonga]|uniref:Uncharacterized protein n=1 Tax=Vanrija pseudolonga TaxID=143232 RepID=A0AAF1BR57_9TREE|nr:hypothetical protein LOC62_07G009047 [Vanrija pseudolonga]